MDGNQIDDVSHLAELTSLTDLRLQGNQVVDVEPLEDLTGLTELWLQDNRITDAEPLADLAGTTRLRLQNNPVWDISYVFADENLVTVLRETIDKPRGPILISDLEALTTLSAARSEITSLSGLEYCANLTRLEASGNQISDISPLAELGELTEVWLQNNQIHDLSALVTNATAGGLSAGDTVDVSGNPLSSFAQTNQVPLLRNVYGVTVVWP